MIILIRSEVRCAMFFLRDVGMITPHTTTSSHLSPPSTSVALSQDQDAKLPCRMRQGGGRRCQSKDAQIV